MDRLKVLWTRVMDIIVAEQYPTLVLAMAGRLVLLKIHVLDKKVAFLCQDLIQELQDLLEILPARVKRTLAVSISIQDMVETVETLYQLMSYLIAAMD